MLTTPSHTRRRVHQIFRVPDSLPTLQRVRITTLTDEFPSAKTFPPSWHRRSLALRSVQRTGANARLCANHFQWVAGRAPCRSCPAASAIAYGYFRSATAIYPAPSRPCDCGGPVRPRQWTHLPPLSQRTPRHTPLQRRLLYLPPSARSLAIQPARLECGGHAAAFPNASTLNNDLTPKALDLRYSNSPRKKSTKSR